MSHRALATYALTVSFLVGGNWACSGADGTADGGPTTSSGGSTSGSGSVPVQGTGGGTASGGVGGGAVAGGAGTGAMAGGGAPSGGGPNTTGPDFETNSAAALTALDTYLATPAGKRSPIAEQGFADVPLTAGDAAAAKDRLWTDFADQVRATRTGEVGATPTSAASLQAAGKTLKYYQGQRGGKPASGFRLFIGMHGGGGTDAATNDAQWENQLPILTAYEPTDAILVTPRAPVDAWNMWFIPEVDALFQRLIVNLIVFEGVDPNRVYITGYSAGGDGTYQLGPRMGDYWAGGAMSAGHPNDAQPDNLRNVPFAIHVGGNDTAYNRNTVAAEWGQKLEMLQAADPGGYVNQWDVHEGLGHWMDLAEKVSIPFLEQSSRDPIASRVVWRQASLTKTRFYWLAVDPDQADQDDRIVAEYDEQTITIEEATGVESLRVRLRDEMMPLDQEVVVVYQGAELFRGLVPRTIATLDRTLSGRGDPELMFSGEVEVALP